MTQPEHDENPGGTVVPFRDPRATGVPHGDGTGGTQAEEPDTDTAVTSQAEATMAETATVEDDARAAPVPHDDAVLQGVPVDSAEVAADTGTYLARTRERMAQAPPIVHPVLRSRHDATEAARHFVRYNAYLMAFHTTRCPLYVLRLMSHSPRGTARLAGRWWGWVSDAEAKPVRATSAGSGDIAQWLAVSREETRRTRPRKVTTAILAGSALVTLFVAGALLPAWALGVGTTLLLCGLGAAGGNPDHPVITRFVSENLLTPLDSAEVVDALRAVGAIKGKGDGGAKFAAPIQRDGPGWRAEVDLPPGVTASTVLDKREELSGAMRRPISTVWPSAAAEIHSGRLVLWVAQQDPATAPRRIWPLMHQGQADVFAPLPLGWDPRGQLVEVTLMYSNLLVGGIPGSGKTSAALAVALGVALDPTAQLWVYELKGSGDLGSVQPVCHRYVSGDDDEDIEATIRGLRSANAEQKRRKKFIQSLPVEEVPEGRRTSRELAAKYPGQRLDPMVVIVDEAQELFGHETYGAEAEQLCQRLIKKARAYGIIIVLLTQDPDAKSLPPTVSRNAGTRLCLAVMDWRANNNVLGTGAYARGLRATDISAAEVGTGILAKQRDHWTLRCAFIKQTEAQEIGRRALALRTAAGTLSGDAAGEEVAEVDASTIVQHLWAVWPDGEEAVHSRDLVAALAAYRPDTYGAWLDIEGADERETETKRSQQLSTALRPFGVHTKQVNRRDRGGNRKGLLLHDLRRATPADEDA